MGVPVIDEAKLRELAVLRKIAAALQAWGPGGAFLLALLDSAGIPLPGGVDALLILTAVTNPDLAYFTAAVCVIGW